MASMSERSTLASISFFSAARYLSEALLLIRGFCLAKILGPALFGVWTQMKLLLLFLQYGRLGTSEAMQREFPYIIGEGRRDRADRIMATTFGFNVMSALVITGVILAVVLLKDTIWNSELRGPWIAFAGIFFITQIYWFKYFKFLTEKKFKQTIKIMLWPAVLSTTIGLLAVLYLNFLGFLIALGLFFLLSIMVSNDGQFPLPKFALDRSILRELIAIGFPIMMSGALLILLWNVDKLTIWILMSKESLGIYTLQFYIASAMMMVPESVSRILYPMLMENFGKNKSLAELARYLVQPNLAISYLACPLIGILFLTLHLPIKWLLPKYILAIRPGEILILAVFFMMIARMPATILVSLNKQKFHYSS